MRNVGLVMVVVWAGVVWSVGCEKRGQRSDDSAREEAAEESDRTEGNASGAKDRSADTTAAEASKRDAGGEAASATGEGTGEPSGRAKVMWTDRALMRALEERGLAFEDRVGASRFDDVAAILEADLKEFQREDPKLGVEVAEHPHRMFDPAWLETSATFFELAGVVSRMDRRPFVDGACGEVRLVYRMAYEAKREGRPLRSRLPMTVAVDWRESTPGDAGCRTAA
ncbi:MAG: hypothetical protein ABEN55_23550, partial [Bradymonadaceae bacterium]